MTVLYAKDVGNTEDGVYFVLILLNKSRTG
jgi:hypothetical protein